MTKTSLPEDERNFPFHPGNLTPILSINGWTSVVLSFLVCRGKPRFLPGKEDILPGKFWMRLCTSLGCNLLGENFSFARVYLQARANPRRTTGFSVNSTIPGKRVLQRVPQHRPKENILGLLLLEEQAEINHFVPRVQ